VVDAHGVGCDLRQNRIPGANIAVYSLDDRAFEFDCVARDDAAIENRMAFFLSQESRYPFRGLSSTRQLIDSATLSSLPQVENACKT